MGCRYVMLLLAIIGTGAAFRMIKSPRGAGRAKTIAGVPVYNYHLAYENKVGLTQPATASNDMTSSAVDWILMLKPDVSPEQLNDFCNGFKNCVPEGHAVQGGIPFVELHGTESDIQSLIESHPGIVHFVEPDSATEVVPEMEAATSASWGLGRIGLEQTSKTGRGVHVYVLDTGVRTTHSDFAGRAIPTLEVIGTVPKVCQGQSDTSCARDVHGHGTHCAGTVGGSTYGVAREATLHGVKVLSDQGSGAVSWIVAAMDWVSVQGERPGVISMSLGGSGRSAAYQVAIDRASANGVTVVVAAGNSNADACNFSPAYVPSAITVGSTTSSDARSSFSNYGTCVEIWAPGSSITSASNRADTGSATMSGTSMACPHVAGAAALLLESSPSMTSTQVLSAMHSNALTDKVTGLKATDTNKFLNVAS